jgi:hypothetical protein
MRCTTIEPLCHPGRGRVRQAERASSNVVSKALAESGTVDLTEEAAILAEGYISRGIFHRKYIRERCTLRSLPFTRSITSLPGIWSSANVRRQARIRLFNTAAGFFVPMIVTPEFLVSEATEKTGV